jgi:hypothetical protein
MELKNDMIWEIVQGAENFESFQSNLLRPINVKPEIPEDIRRNIEIIQKLLVHSYFEYDFIDIALLHANITLEKALKIRYKEIENNNKRLHFEKLVDWLYNSGHFKVYNREILDIIRDIRNRKVHETKNSVLGMAFIGRIYGIIDLINYIY